MGGKDVKAQRSAVGGQSAVGRETRWWGGDSRAPARAVKGRRMRASAVGQYPARRHTVWGEGGRDSVPPGGARMRRDEFIVPTAWAHIVWNRNKSQVAWQVSKATGHEALGLESDPEPQRSVLNYRNPPLQNKSIVFNMRPVNSPSSGAKIL